MRAGKLATGAKKTKLMSRTSKKSHDKALNKTPDCSSNLAAFFDCIEVSQSRILYTVFWIERKPCTNGSRSHRAYILILKTIKI